MLVRIFFFLSIIFNPTLSIAECKFNTSNYIFELKNPKNIKFIEIETPKSQRYVRNFIQTLASSFESGIILPKYKKNFFAKINVEYPFGRCEFEGKIRQSGDWPDHIKVKNGNPFRSLDVKLNSGNILNAVKFKLLIPETRNSQNEILGSLILKELGFITPETFEVFTKINGITNVMIFQEKSEKELLERNNRKEGPIFEGDEELLWNYDDFKIHELENVSLAKLLNQNWFSKGKNNQIITLKAFQKLQLAYLDYIQYHIKSKTIMYPNLNKNDVFINYHLLLEIMNGHHALRPHNRKYYHNFYLDSFEPIYYDGMFELSKPIMKFNKEIYSNTQKLKINKYLGLLNDKSIRIKLKDKFDSRVVTGNDVFFKKSLNQITKNLEYAKKNISSDIFLINNRPQNEQNRNNYFESHINQNLDQFILEDVRISQKKYEVKMISILNKEKISKNISVNDMAEILSKNRLANERVIFLPQNNIFDNGSFNFKTMGFNGGQVIYSQNMKMNVNYKEKIIYLNQSFSNDWILFSNATFDNWKIVFKGKPHNDEDENFQNINQYGMSGCVNFYNTSFNGSILKLQNGKCEDTINIVNSFGRIKSIEVKSAFSDAVDIDFSKINIDQGIIDKAGNDCLDFSGGEYEINNFRLSNCNDKAISIGEMSIFNSADVSIKNSGIGIASKDSSISKIQNVSLNNVDICLSAYNKKQEFYGGIIGLENIICNNFSKKTNKDSQSNIDVKKWN